MREILDADPIAVERGDPSTCICWAGIGRTGTVVGCWLVEAGRSGDDVLEAIKVLRATTMKRWTQSPETSDQGGLLLEWPAGRSD